MDWQREDRASSLWALIDAVWSVEEIDIAAIRDLSDENEISCDRFVEVWNELCDEAHIIVHQSEDKIF